LYCFGIGSWANKTEKVFVDDWDDNSSTDFSETYLDPLDFDRPKRSPRLPWKKGPSRPQDFSSQLRLLDELEGTGYRMPLQVQLEHAILLHQENRSLEANRKFRNIEAYAQENPRVLFRPSQNLNGGFHHFIVKESKGGLASFVEQYASFEDLSRVIDVLKSLRYHLAAC
jgi:hypothetical protein